MKLRFFAVLAAALLIAPAVATVPASAATGGWGEAIEVPGITALNTGNSAQIDSVSCPSASDCAADGTYKTKQGSTYPFVVSEVSGTWQRALRVPGAPANTGIDSLSCGSPGNCAVAMKSDATLLVDQEANGVWGTTAAIAGLAALNHGGSFSDGVNAISCAAPGSCSVGGFYTGSDSFKHAFIADEVNGVWHDAFQVQGLTPASATFLTEINSISCRSAGNCTAGGQHGMPSGDLVLFAVREVNGTWGSATALPGLAGLNVGGKAALDLVSCASPGNCAASGNYTDAARNNQAFVASEANGVWHNAIEVPGTAGLNALGFADADALSCPAAGDCVAAGYVSGNPATTVFVASEVNGTWQKATVLPGIAALNTGDFAWPNAVSCTSPGNCSIGGYYTTGSQTSVAYLADEVNGVWQDAAQVPGLASLHGASNSDVQSVACGAPGNCAAGGDYWSGTSFEEPFVVNRS